MFNPVRFSPKILDTNWTKLTRYKNRIKSPSNGYFGSLIKDVALDFWSYPNLGTFAHFNQKMWFWAYFQIRSKIWWKIFEINDPENHFFDTSASFDFSSQINFIHVRFQMHIFGLNSGPHWKSSVIFVISDPKYKSVLCSILSYFLLEFPNWRYMNPLPTPVWENTLTWTETKPATGRSSLSDLAIQKWGGGIHGTLHSFRFFLQLKKSYNIDPNISSDRDFR